VSQLPPGLRVVDLNSPRTVWDIPRLVRFLRSQRPDLLLSNVDLNNIAALLAKALSFSRTSLVICQHNPLSGSFRASESWMYRYVGLSYRLLSPLITRAVAVSAGVADELNRISGLPAARILTINNPVVGPDFQSRCEDSVEHRWFGQPDRAVFVTAGRLVGQKDHDTMLRALALHRRHADSRLLILGAGPLREHLESLTRELGLADAVDFLGFRSNALPFFRRADAFVLSSRCEGFGNVLVEALGCGTPVISARCDYGPAEILAEGRFGVLVEPRDPIALAAAMDQVSTLRERFPASQLQDRARDFSYDACASRYLNLFKTLAPHRAWAT
jgi:glycosyltransferase involved in cell wall biosynthesis